MLGRAILAGLSVAISVGMAGAAQQGDAERGARLFAKCKSCHMVGPEARNRVGPHLNELFGRRAGSVDGYDYSKDLAREGADGLVWTLDKLHIYIDNPKALVSQTFMNFRGMKDEKDRTDLLAFLRQFTASPSDIPEAEPTALPRDPEVKANVLAIEGDRDYGEYLASECTTCHQQDGADEGIPSITGWPKEDFVTAMHAYKVKYRPHPVMQMMAGRLSNEEIAALAAYFEDVE